MENPGFRIYEGNRAEKLAERLAERLKESAAGPFGREYVLVQSKGMEQWLRLEIARRNGVCANIRFPFPDNFAYRLFREISKGLPNESPYNSAPLTWRIAGMLEGCLEEPVFKPLKEYASGAEPSLKLLQLSERLACAYDRYLIYRPDWIASWERGSDIRPKSQHTAWQAELWRRLSSELSSRGFPHRVRLHRMLVEGLKNGFRPRLPGRLSVFGISSMPPFYLDILRELSRVVSVELYHINPCREHWSYIKSPKAAAESLDSDEISGEDWSFLVGNSLLGSFGRVGREFSSLLLDQLEESETESLFHDPGRGTLLSAIQSDMLNLVERGDGLAEKPLELPESALNINIHSCHSRMRELEVLNDQLLYLFGRLPGLLPEDIVVMAPDISEYAPLVEAVFGAPESESLRIPYSIEDKSLDSGSTLASCLMSMLSLTKSRFTATEVMDILSCPPVMRKAGFTEESLQSTVRLVKGSGIRWAFDASDKEALSLPAFNENTWRFGLDRMLLGHACPAGESAGKLFEGMLPYDAIEGESAKELGLLSRFAERLHECVLRLNEPKSLRAWDEELSGMLSDFFDASGGFEAEMLELRQALSSQSLGLSAELSDFEGDVPVSLLSMHLKKLLSAIQKASHGFKSGRACFCTLTPMRCIPFRVVCLVGMNDGEFPRESRTPSFDLMRCERRRCDLNRRNNDRYLLLEAILSARDSLVITYIGQSQKDNSPLPPSPAVAELADCIAKGFRTDGGSPAPDSILFNHRLQPFSPEYFKEGSRLFSFSECSCAAAKASTDSRMRPRSFLKDSLPEPERSLEFNLDGLIRFLSNTSRHFLQGRLDATLESGREDSLEDSEPEGLDGLEAYKLKARLLDSRLKGFDPSEDSYASVRASGTLPPGANGISLCKELDAEMSRLTERVKGFSSSTAHTFDGSLMLPSGKSLKLSLQGLHEEGMLIHRAGKVRAKYRLAAWLRHLALCALDDCPGTARLTSVFGEGGDSASFKAVMPEDALRQLDMIAGLYGDGLSKPIPFFPESSLEFVSNEGSFESAERKWLPGFIRGMSESEDPYVAECFPDGFPCSDEFSGVAEEIFMPMVKAEDGE